MKRIIYLAIYALLAVYSCGNPSNEEKAKTLIKNYIDKHADDPESYEAVAFGSLDSMTSISMIGTGVEYANLQRDFDKSTDMEKRKSIMAQQQEVLKDRQGFRITHKYRANNALGAKILSEDVFYLNAGLDSVLTVRKTGE